MINKKIPLFFSIIIIVLELAFLPFSVYSFLNPIPKIYIPFYITNFLFPMLIFILGLRYQKSFLFVFVFLFHGYLMIPTMLFMLARILSTHYQSIELSVFLFTSLAFIIPVTIHEIHYLFKDFDITYPLEYYEELEENEKKEVKFFSLIIKSLFSTAFFRIILLMIITFTDYIGINVPFIKDINAGIITSIAFDSFLKPFIKKIRYRRISIIKQKLLTEREARDTQIDHTISKCFQEASSNERIANKFIDLLSRYYCGLTLSEIKRINSHCYVYLKNTCSDFFKEYPYMTEDKITTTYLFVWSENKDLKDVPIKYFGF